MLIHIFCGPQPIFSWTWGAEYLYIQSVMITIVNIKNYFALSLLTLNVETVQLLYLTFTDGDNLDLIQLIFSWIVLYNSIYSLSSVPTALLYLIEQLVLFVESPRRYWCWELRCWVKTKVQEKKLQTSFSAPGVGHWSCWQGPAEVEPDYIWLSTSDPVHL